MAGAGLALNLGHRPPRGRRINLPPELPLLYRQPAPPAAGRGCRGGQEELNPPRTYPRDACGHNRTNAPREFQKAYDVVG